MSRLRILSFGHMPTWAGGRQESGLANVIYNLAVSMSKCENVDMSLVATDFYKSQKIIGKLRIFGWNKQRLVIYAILHPLFSIYLFACLLNCKRKYKCFVNILEMYFKGLFLNMTIRKIKPDVVHLHAAHSIVYLPAIPYKISVVLTHHGIVGYDPHIANSDIYARIENDTCHSSRFSKLYFISNKLIDDYTRQYGSIDMPTETILDAYDNTKFYKTEHIIQDKLTLVTIASFSDNKGQERVIEAIGSSGVSCRYICVGAADKNILNKVKRRASDLNVDFVYVGKKQPSEIRKILASADYMILPSSTEGFGLVYLESIACGVPVILPKHLPIVQEIGIIKPNINALLLEDSSSASIANLLRNLSNYSFNQTDVANSIVQFTWENIGIEYINSISKLIYKM